MPKFCLFLVAKYFSALIPQLLIFYKRFILSNFDLKNFYNTASRRSIERHDDDDGCLKFYDSDDLFSSSKHPLFICLHLNGTSFSNYSYFTEERERERERHTFQESSVVNVIKQLFRR